MLSSIVSYGQTGDTLTSYNNQELKKIATRVVRANECDTLLKVSEAQKETLKVAVHALEQEVAAKDSSLYHQGNIVKLKEELLTIQNTEISNLKQSLKKSERKRKWLTVGWISTSAILTGVITAIIVK